MQLKGSASVSRKEASGALILITTVAGSGASMLAMSANSSLRIETMPAGRIADTVEGRLHVLGGERAAVVEDARRSGS